MSDQEQVAAVDLTDPAVEPKTDGTLVLMRKAAAWDALMEICGHWQDDSHQRVILHQDDATRTCIISTGGPDSRRVGMYFKDGGSFEAALADYAEKHPKGG